MLVKSLTTWDVNCLLKEIFHGVGISYGSWQHSIASEFCKNGNLVRCKNTLLQLSMHQQTTHEWQIQNLGKWVVFLTHQESRRGKKVHYVQQAYGEKNLYLQLLTKRIETKLNIRIYDETNHNWTMVAAHMTSYECFYLTITSRARSQLSQYSSMSGYWPKGASRGSKKIFLQPSQAYTQSF